MDVVITWVDGDDPVHRAKRMKYMGLTPDSTMDDIGGETRFKAMGEIGWSVASINRFAPFVRKIFIVTDSQDPHLSDFLAENFKRPIPIELIDHKEIFKGYEAALPTFNSLSIETMLWNIPGLDEQFVYFNDDFMLLAPISPGDWFDGEGRAVCEANRFSSMFASILRAVKPKKNGHKPFGYKDAMLNASDLLEKKYFWLYGHCPAPMLKSVLRDYFESNREIMEENISFRFRDPVQFSPQQLFCLLAEDMGKLKIVSPKGRHALLKPDKSKPDYLRKRLERIDGKPTVKYGCINSLDRGSEEDQKLFAEWINKRLGLRSPNPD